MECPKCGAPLEENICPYCGHISEEEKANVTIINNIYRDNTSTYPAKMNQNLLPPVKKKRPLAIVFISIIIFVFVVIPLIGHNTRNSSKGNNASHSQIDTSVQIDNVTEQTSTPIEDYKITYQNAVIYKNTLGKNICSCIVEIENTGKVDLYLDDAVFDFEDKDGNLLATYSTLISCDPERISKGEKGYFYCNSAPVAGNIDENTEYIFSPKLKVEKSKYDIIEYEISETSISEGRHSSEYTVIGRINNITDEDDSMVWLCCVLYRDDGTPIAASGTNILDLRAGETRSFDIKGIELSEWNIEMYEIADYKVYAFKSQYQ